jgi:riboflavin kinase/FMN adenylyltransferase
VLPIKGVFLVKALVNDERLFGVANIGNKPTLNGVKPLIEVNLFNFDKNIYGVRIDIEPVLKLRDEQKFNSIDELISQINQDVVAAKAAISKLEL